MAEGGSYIGLDKFKCPVCLDLLKNPVTIPCGHSYCMQCIEGCWNKGDNIGVHVCPQCRQMFTPRPILVKNALLSEVVEKLQTEGSNPAVNVRSVQCYAGFGDVACDVCIGRKIKATKSCLVCLASYCETHLQPHYECKAFQKHKLVTAVGRLQDRICSRHDKLLEFYCQTDRMCICYMCVMGEHKGHTSVPTETARSTKTVQQQLGAAQRNSQQRIKTKEKELKELRQVVESLRHPSKVAIDNSCKARDDLMNAVMGWQTELVRAIQAEESRVVSHAEGILAQQEEELTVLRKRGTELHQLSETEDHIHFLQSIQALCNASPGTGFITSAKKGVSSLQEGLEDFCKKELKRFSKRAKEMEAQVFVPKTRGDFLRYACSLTLDPNTAHQNLELSDENRAVTGSNPRSYPPHPDRFEYQEQVLCKEGLSGARFYWEVEGDLNMVYIAVCYHCIPRKEGIWTNELMHSPHSLCLEYRQLGGCSSVHHKDGEAKFAMNNRHMPNTKVGVFLDHPAGLLSFYMVQETTMLHLHTVRTSFTGPLYPALAVGPNRTLRLTRLEATGTSSM